MTLREYYNAVHKMEAPQDITWYEKLDFYEAEVEKLRKRLSKEDLEEVLSVQRHLFDKMQSSAESGQIASA